MGLCIIAASGWWSYVEVGWYWILAILALGVVIFVHELGHFLVAKACRVKCEKFYLGFDIGGVKIAKYRWGETEYGIGILPLGGYVKMLGQEDNPARLREELERGAPAEASPPAPPAVGQHGQVPPSAAAPAAPGETAVQSVSADTAVPRAAQDAASAGPPDDDPQHAQEALFNPRSFLAKSVPARMAIISAGVIMNVVFALTAAVIAYRAGVEQVPSRVGQVVPGSGAWRAGVKMGDDVLAVNGQPIERFYDLKTSVSLGDNLSQGVTLTLRRPGVAQPFSVTAVADVSGNMPTIGVTLPLCTTLDGALLAYPGTPAAEASPAFQDADRIVAVDGQPVRSAAEFEAAEAREPARVLQVTVLRQTAKQAAAGDEGQRVTIPLPPRPMLDLGLTMELGEVVAVQAGSPAEKAGLLPGDMLHRVDGEPLGDPMSLPARLPPAGDTVTLSLTRKNVPIDVPVSVRKADWFESPALPGAPMSVPQLGIAYRVLNRIHSVTPGSPADTAGLKPGDKIEQAAILAPKQSEVPAGLRGDFQVTINEKTRNWPYFFFALQKALPNSLVEFTLDGGRKVTLQPRLAEGWMNPDRGLYLPPDTFVQQAHTWRDAVRLGWQETVDATTLVFRVLRKLGGGQISPREVSGPLGILKQASYAARAGMPQLLLFLTLISANLAVLNFLPIPVLDGGHMIFLAYEGIRGKPANENVQVVLTYVGLFLILGLMVWVLGLDLGLISRA